MASAIINMPKTAKPGEVILIRALIAHPMETGLRPGADGKVIPANLIRQFTCLLDDGVIKMTVFEAELFAAVAANPFFSFHLQVKGNCKLTFNWRGDDGFNQTETATLTMT
jgi:sulfur-oxidizing protein SoxZ